MDLLLQSIICSARHFPFWVATTRITSSSSSQGLGQKTKQDLLKEESEKMKVFAQQLRSKPQFIAVFKVCNIISSDNSWNEDNILYVQVVSSIFINSLYAMKIGLEFLDIYSKSSAVYNYNQLSRTFRHKQVFAGYGKALSIYQHLTLVTDPIFFCF